MSMSTRTIVWDRGTLADEADRAFNRILIAVGLPLLGIGLLLAFVTITLEKPLREYTSTRYVELLPPPVIPKAEPPKVEASPESGKKDVSKKDKPPEPKISPEVAREIAAQKARQRASKEISKAFGGLSGLLTTPAAPTSRSLTSGSKTAQAGDGGLNSAFFKDATSTSGGIGKGGTVQRGGGTTEIAGRDTQRVSGPADLARAVKDSGAPGRSLAEIQLVFDRNKSALISLYNRARREAPDMQGKMVVSLTIEPDGSVADCRLVSSELGNPDLERKIVARILLFNFGAKAVPRFTYPNYPIIFLPT